MRYSNTYERECTYVCLPIDLMEELALAGIIEVPQQRLQQENKKKMRGGKGKKIHVPKRLEIH